MEPVNLNKDLVVKEAKSDLLTLNGKDWKKGAVMAFIGSLLGSLVQLGQVDFSTIDKHTLIGAGVGAVVSGASYLLKNLFSSEEGVPITSTAGKEIVKQKLDLQNDQ